jgi:hypothetical protein
MGTSPSTKSNKLRMIFLVKRPKESGRGSDGERKQGQDDGGDGTVNGDKVRRCEVADRQG